MKRILIAVALTSLGQAAWSMDFLCGDWQGTVTMHDETPAAVIYRVKQQDSENASELKITMFYNERPYVFKDLVVDNDGMNFTLDTGDKYTCELELDDSDGYKGQCRYQDAGKERLILISMAPSEAEYDECTIETDDQAAD